MALTQANEQIPLSPVVVGYVLLSGQTGAIGSTQILPAVPAGIYRANVTVMVTTTGTSGNLVANIIVTDDSQAETIAAGTIAAITSKGQANSAVIIENTASATINYSTTLSGTAGALVYSLYIVLERIF
jgi:hypothetical protein